MLRLALVCLSCTAVGAQAWAQDAGPAKPWSLSLAASGAQADGDSDSFRSGSISLERSFDGFRLGGSIGGSDGEVLIPDLVSVTDTSSTQGAVWWGFNVGEVDFTLTAGVGRQSLDAQITPPTTAPAAVRNRSGAITGEITSTSFGGTLSRSFGETTSWTPYATLSYSETETDAAFLGQGGAGARFTIGRTNSGATGGVGLDLLHAFNDSFQFTGGASFLAAEDGASTLYTQRRKGGFQPSSQQAEGAVQWGEIYGGFSLQATGGASFGFSIGSTLGRNEDEVFGSASLGWVF